MRGHRRTPSAIGGSLTGSPLRLSLAVLAATKRRGRAAAQQLAASTCATARHSAPPSRRYNPEPCATMPCPGRTDQRGGPRRHAADFIGGLTRHDAPGAAGPGSLLSPSNGCSVPSPWHQHSGLAGIPFPGQHHIEGPAPAFAGRFLLSKKGRPPERVPFLLRAQIGRHRRAMAL
jgi:hypothetical protein